MTRRFSAAAALLLALVVPQIAFGHAERPTPSPARKGPVPDQNRTHATTIDVCKVAGCAIQHIQTAVDMAADNTLIRIWPGFYREEPSRAIPAGEPDNPDGTFSYEYMLENPNAENLVAVVGKKNITLRGMGRDPRDVVVDAEFKKHVAIRGDRSDGIIIENISVWHGYDHGVYVLDTDGFVIDRVVSGYSREYPFLTFANDYGLMKNCEAFGAGDGGIYPGSSADTPGRVSTEIRNCRSYHNVLGYSGTQGDHVWVHDNEFYDNAVGLVTDSETDHPNYPQNNLVLERNRFYDNNFNVYSKDSDIKATVFANSILIPVGVGVLIASGNNNMVQNNDIWGHDRYGVWFINGPGLVLGPGAPVVDGGPFAPPFVSEGNRFIGNRMYDPAAPEGSQNETDFAWDGIGLTNCWESNVRSPDGEPATGNGLMLPPCTNPVDGSSLPLTPGIPDPANAYEQVGLVFIDTDGDDTADTPICDLAGTCGIEYDEGPPLENARNFPEGYVAPDEPTPCGPGTCATASSSVQRSSFSRTFSGSASALPATGVAATAGSAIGLLAAAATTARVLRRRR